MDERTVKLRITKVDFPEGIHGASMPGSKGDSYIIAVNANDPQERQEEAFLHEMRHIFNRDHDHKGRGVSAVEELRHRSGLQVQGNPARS